MRGITARLAWVVALAPLIVGAPRVAGAQDAPRNVAEALKAEAADALPLTPFYDTPANLAATKPGALLREERSDGYALPKGVRAVRILYHSLDATGHAVATSAVVLIPAGATPPGGWPVIAWAHGTSGVARQCAPSLMKDVYYGEEGLFPMVRAGYAVVATDYRGLGSEGPHQYVNKLAQGYDVIFSIPAARAAAPQLGARWVVDGHSQGGLAAWSVAELEHSRHDAGYLGAVAVAPGADLGDMLNAGPLAAGNGFYIDYVAWGARARTPSFRPSQMLSGDLLARYHDVTTKGCFEYGYASFLGDTGPAALKPGWEAATGVRRLFRETEVAQSPIDGPLLVIAGGGDHTVPIAAVRAEVGEACRRGIALQFRSYPGLDHDPTMVKSTPDQLAWIADRFAGKPASDSCPAAPG